MKIVLTAAVALTGSLLAAPAASASDARFSDPCVSNQEFASAQIQTREALEARWDVTGRGRSRETPMYGHVVAYPWCGHKMGEAWIGVDYARRGDHQLALGIVLYQSGSAEPPPPAAAPDTPPAIVPCDDSCG